MSKPTDLDAVQQLCDAATPGPWASLNGGVWPDAPEPRICVPSKCPNRDGEVTQQDIDFAIAARDLVPQMAAEIRELRAERDAVVDRAVRAEQARDDWQNSAQLSSRFVEAERSRLDLSAIDWREQWFQTSSRLRGALERAVQAETLAERAARDANELRAELAAERARTDALVAATEFVFVVPAHLPGRTHRAVRDGENWRIERHMMPTLGVSTWGQVEEYGDQATAVRRARELAGLNEEERERR